MEKLRIHSKGRALHVADVIGFFSEITEVCSFNATSVVLHKLMHAMGSTKKQEASAF